MTGIIVLILIGLGIFLYWFGYEVTSGKHKPKPNDKFFPLLGRNIDYVLGMAGIPMALAMFVLAFAVWADLKFLNYVAAVLVLFGIARAYLSPEHYGPSWLRGKHAKRSSGKKRKK
jgi:hypothetical protein